MSRFLPEKYTADGGFTVTGLPILLGLLCAVGIGLGWLASFIGQWFYLVVLFPLGMGLVLSLVGLVGVQWTKMRSTGMAILLGLVSSGVTLLAMHYFNYQRFLDERRELMPAEPLLDNLSPDAMDAETAQAAQFLKKAQAVNSLPSYLDLEATQGVTIGRGKKGMNLGYIGTWVYWGLELVGVAFAATLGLILGASTPFCPACQKWKVERQLGTLYRKDADVAAFLSNGEIERLREHDPAPAGGDLILTVAVCPHCKGESPIAVKLREVTKNAKGEEVKNDLVHLTYPGEALAEFEALFGNKLQPT